MDTLDCLPRWVFKLMGLFVNGWYRLLGDASPDFCGVWRGPGRRGLSHLDEVDFRRRPLRGKDAPVDPAERYAALVAELRERGF